MKRETIILFLITIVFVSCSATKKNTGNSAINNNKEFAASILQSTDDGLSFSTAIVITETTETTGVDAEYKWIKAHYTDYTVKMQSLNMYNNKPYDIITIVFADSKELKLYFDISNYFGKF